MIETTDIYVSVNYPEYGFYGGMERLELEYKGYKNLLKNLKQLQEDDLINLSYIHLSNVPKMIQKQVTFFTNNFLKFKLSNIKVSECIEEIIRYERKTQ